MKIVALDAATLLFSEERWTPLKSLGELALHHKTEYRDEVIADRLRGATVAITNKVPVTREVMQVADALRLIAVTATGYNIVDLEAARERGVSVCNVPAYSTASVVQHTLALILELTNHVALHAHAVRDGDWIASEQFFFLRQPITELRGRTVGLVGMGMIGRGVADVLLSLGANVQAFTPSRRGGPDHADFAWVDLPTLFASSDIVSLHCPQTPENAQFVNADLLATMKRSALLINTARGTLIDEQALADALHAGTIAGAGLDVVASEPMRPDNPLKDAPNCFITPHIAWSSEPARTLLLDTTIANIRGFVEGSPQNVVS